MAKHPSIKEIPMKKAKPADQESVEKRSVHTDALATLGMVLTKLERQHRDAIHLAVEPAIAGEDLRAGDHIGIDTNGLAYRASCRPSNGDFKALGIVDPFITERLETGDHFWLVVYPRQITSLRHVWDHPDFPRPKELETGSMSIKPVLDAAVEKALRAEITRLEEEVNVHKCKAEASAKNIDDAIAAITSFADELGSSYMDVMTRANAYVEHGKSWNEGKRFDGKSLPSDFWDNYQKITGKRPEDDWSFFSCSC